jgi:3-dehydroquinate synthase/2-deoxy-scyllo-inosose synthase
VLEHRLTFGDLEVPYLYGADCEADLAAAVLDRLGDLDALLLVVDDRVTGHAARLATRLTRSTRVETFALRALPEHKTLGSVQDIMGFAIDRGLTRRSAIVAMGGGTAGNVAGLAASLLFRGTRLVHLPTTPVAAFDAVISLKQAVNLSAGKNLCGTYFPPTLIACDLRWLTTVPRADLLAGLAEMVKNVLVSAPGQENKLAAAIGALPTHPHEALRHLLEIGIDAKAPFLRTDPQERQAALVFEYGHTAGHALEFLGGVSHGEAVAWGMLAAAEVGRRYGLSEADVGTHRRLTALLDLPDPGPLIRRLDRTALRVALAADNKRGYGPCAPDEVLMVVLDAIGRPVVPGPATAEAGVSGGAGRPPLVPVPVNELMAAIDTVAAAHVREMVQ